MLSGLFLLTYLVFSFSDTQKLQGDAAPTSVSLKKDSPPQAPLKLSLEDEFPHIMKRNLPLYSHLIKLDVPSNEILELVKAAKPLKDLSRLSAGTRFKIVHGAHKILEEIRFYFSPVESLKIKKENKKWTAQLLTEPVTTELVSFLGTVETSLWASTLSADMDPYLIVALSEIFAWEVDFNREVRSGDRWRITAEKKMANGKHVGWGSILAAEYINAGKSHKAVLFRHKNKDMGYYTLKGESLRKMFLKSPLRFGRVTSRFNRRRFHPRLKRIRPHNGVDYGAPTGTPVRSVANGVVTFARRSGGGGKVLKIRHNSIYKTAYKHLSRYGKGIRKGRRVKQGQVVAYVGNTGLSTGPHLHYEFLKNGRFKDPLRQKFPSAKPLEQKYKAEFAKQSLKRLATLPRWSPKNFVLLQED